MDIGRTRKNNKVTNRYCSVPQCKSKQSMEISLHRLPKDITLQKRWLQILKFGKKVPKNTFVCSLHFCKSDYILPDVQTKKPLLKKDVVPSQNIPVSSTKKSLSAAKKPYKNRRKDRISLRRYTENYNEASFTNSCTDNCENQEERMEAAHALIELSNITVLSDTTNIKDTDDKEVQVSTSDLLFKNKFSIRYLLKTDRQINSFTGIPNIKIIQALHDSILLLEDDNEKYSVPLMDRIILIFIKLKLNLTFRCISVLFEISSKTCKNYFITTIPLVAVVLKTCIHWPSKGEILKNMPLCFEKFKDTRIVLDCTEIPVEKSKCLQCKIRTYSHYKGTNTIKFLIGVAPSGLVTFISKAFGGRASDKSIFLKSGVLDLLKANEDALMVDRGFLIENECCTNKIKLYRPPFLGKNKKLTAVDAVYTSEIAAARVHVERSIQRIKIFKIFNGSKIPFNLLCHIDDIMTIICGIVNLTRPIISDDRFIS